MPPTLHTTLGQADANEDMSARHLAASHPDRLGPTWFKHHVRSKNIDFVHQVGNSLKGHHFLNQINFVV